MLEILSDLSFRETCRHNHRYPLLKEVVHCLRVKQPKACKIKKVIDITNRIKKQKKQKKKKRTRARARRGPNTPGRRHCLTYKNDWSLWQWYKAKSMDQEIYVTDPHIFYKVDLCVTLIHYPKYNISPLKRLQDMKDNCCTVKYRSRTNIYLIRSIYASHWSIIPTMMFIHQIILKILSKITRAWNICHVDLYLLWGQSLGQTISLSEYITLMHQIVLEI